jgi:hypothetical protein
MLLTEHQCVAEVQTTYDSNIRFSCSLKSLAIRSTVSRNLSITLSLFKKNQSSFSYYIYDNVTRRSFIIIVE